MLIRQIDTINKVRAYLNGVRRMHRKSPYRRVNEGFYGIGLGSLVTCRHHLSESRRRTTAYSHTPVPGESSRTVQPPENTAHDDFTRYTGTRASRSLSQSEDAEQAGAVFPVFLAGCKT